MKLFLSSLWLALSALLFQTDLQTRILTGTVRNAETGAAIAGAQIRLLQHYALVRNIATDDKGQFKLTVEPGQYALECAFPGFVTKRITEVLVAETGEDLVFPLSLRPGAVLDEVSAVDFETFLRLSAADPTPAPSTPARPDPSGWEPTMLSGMVRDDKEELPGASITVKQGGKLVRGAVTDATGAYRVQLVPGDYEVEVSYTGYKTQQMTGIRLVSGVNTQDFTLSTDASLTEVVIMEYKVPLIKQDETATGMALTSEQIKALPTRSPVIKEAPPAPTTSKPTPSADKPGATSIEGGDVAIKGARSTGKDYYIDGVRVTGAPPPPPAETPAMLSETVVVSRAGKAKSLPKTTEKSAKARDMEPLKKREAGERVMEELEASDEMPRPESGGAPAQPAPRAGLLTAGEWNDLNNWSRHWVDLLNDGEIEGYQKMYTFYPKHRYTVLLTNEQDYPVADAPVTLFSASGEALWAGRTDNTGKAELWAGLFADQRAPERVRAKVSLNGKDEDLGELKPFKDGINRRKIAAPCNAPQNVDIVWAVDATGSMGDEIEYLKTELLDVIGRAKSLNPNLSFRMGTVFYRDKGDDYLTQSSGLSYEIGKTVDFIRKQFAGGGGDYPEAVESALDEAVYNQRWSEHAIARICFLVLDASPHQSPEVNERLQRSIREAARRGIRVVPIAASGIQKDTEFLMKFFGLATNGSYVFLTDHSGVGGKHIEATTDEYKVEPLNALLVRLLTEYTAIQTCEGKSAIRFDDPQQTGQDWQALYYPNPAFGQFTLELPIDVQTVTLYNAEGKAVKKLEKAAAGKHTIALGDLSDGVYTIRIHKDNQYQTGKLVVAGR